VGSLERFIGVLTEHTAGNFPTWLAPTQVSVLPISEKSLDYGLEVLAELRAQGIRAMIDESEDKISAKIRNAEIKKIPYMLIVGEKEAAVGNVGVRRHGEGDKGAQPRDEFIRSLKAEIKERR
jgi:threonyl-tRNA synthetase